MDRRNLIQFVAGTVAASSLANTTFASSAEEPRNNREIELKDGSLVLFQGDSITDAQRDKKKFASRPNNAQALGNGYPFLIAGELLRNHPTKNLKIMNRGISGNKVPDLQKRWQKDCLDLKPALLSIMIGVNDILHKMLRGYDGSVDDYRKGFTELVTQTRTELPDVQLVICEPFYISSGRFKNTSPPEYKERWKVAAEVAAAAEAIWVPFQTMFDTAIAQGSEPTVWSTDGVHPTMAGHVLMAETWRKCVGI